MRYLLLSACLLSLGLAATEETTQTKLAKFGSDLVDAWKTYPKEKDETVRKQKINDLSTAMTASINKTPAPEMTLDKLVNTYLGNLEKARTLFIQEKMQAERAQFVATCGQVYRREVQFATDLKTERTPKQCFAMVVDWATLAKSRLSKIPDDARTNFFSALGETFTLMLKSARKDEGDPTQIYDEQLKQVRAKFPTATEAFQAVNGPIATMLEGAAKMGNTFNKR